MPLSDPAPRDHLHTRNVTCTGYRRSDGLWDIEGHITDVKTYGFQNHDRGDIPAGEPIHQMWLRLTIDDHMVIQAVEAVTDHAPFAACNEIAPNYEKLVGLKIGPGLKQQIRERVGGIDGCTHLTELMGPVATTAFQTIFPLRAKEAAEKQRRAEEQGMAAPRKKRSPLVNSCHGWRSDGAAVKRIAPDSYTGPQDD